MTTEDTFQPIGSDVLALRRTLEEWEVITTGLLEVLHRDEENDETSVDWWPHRPRMIAAIEKFRDGCREEHERAGRWRADELDPDDVHELLWDQGDRLAKWLQRMVGNPE